MADQQKCSQLNDTSHSQAITQQTVALAEAKTLAQSQTTLKDQAQAELQSLKASQGQSRQSTKADQQAAELIAEEEGQTMRKSLTELRKAVALLLHKPPVSDTKIACDVIQQITKQVQRSSMEITRPGDAIIDHSNQQADALRTIQRIEFEQGIETFGTNIRDELGWMELVATAFGAQGRSLEELLSEGKSEPETGALHDAFKETTTDGGHAQRILDTSAGLDRIVDRISELTNGRGATANNTTQEIDNEVSSRQTGCLLQEVTNTRFRIRQLEIAGHQRNMVQHALEVMVLELKRGQKPLDFRLYSANQMAELQTKVKRADKKVLQLNKQILESDTLRQSNGVKHTQALQELAQQKEDCSLVTEQKRSAEAVIAKHAAEMEKQQLIIARVEEQLTEAQEKLDNLQTVSPTTEEANRKDGLFAVGEMEYSHSILDNERIQEQLGQLLQTA